MQKKRKTRRKQIDACDRCPAYYRADCEAAGKVHEPLCLLRVLIYEALTKKKGGAREGGGEDG